MRVFLYEFLCGGGATSPLTASLRAEGEAMLRAVLEDLRQVPGVEAFTLVDDAARELMRNGLDRQLRPSARRCPEPAVLQGGELEAAFRAAVQDAESVLVIAPESDGILSTLCRWVEEEGRPLLGPSSVAVTLAGDKLALGERLREDGVPTPPCRLWQPGSPVPALDFPMVGKPRHGAGAELTFLVRSADELAAVTALLEEAAVTSDFLLQPFVPGQPASVAFLLGTGRELALPAAAQLLALDRRIHYRGGRVPLSPELAARVEQLARRAVRVVEGLRGYVGVDVVLGEPDDGSGDWVIEIDPRLTTSYVGLRALARTNLAEVMLRVVAQQTLPELHWRQQTVEFRADGVVQVLPEG